MQILQEQKSALPPTPANRATKIYDQILNRQNLQTNSSKTATIPKIIASLNHIRASVVRPD
ncbi:hypothetical protein [Methylotuvimicrobium buryatense]|uniref:Uncharacterized protein n=1 Tax=Methylotuvimicrobium buryatense TaxID=95641 RepID=A0A4V1IJV5_METBY|nr:hypothetical protein [Methylotuvimicrobium buryatense]QCW82725.1 hypothetical protein EQU24_11105 [Methylotuvimicrobium buryatense]